MKNALFLACAACALPFAAMAEEPVDTSDIKPGKKLEIVRTTPEVKDILEKTRPQDPNAIPTPKFALKSQNNNFIMTIGGQLNVVMGGDMGNDLYKNPNAGISFVTNAIPVPARAGHRGDFYINPLDGAVDMQIVGLANTPDEISAYFKVGTNGVNTSLAVQRAYLSYRRFTAGLKLTLFQDDNACQPPTIDPQGPSGCVSAAVYELNYTSKSYNGFRFAIGADIPTWNSSLGYYRGHDYPSFDGKQVSNYADADQIIPDFPAWVEYTFSPWNRIRVSGILRNFAYRDLIADKTRHNVGWGVMLSGNIKPIDQLVLYYQAAYGKGIGAYLQDIAGHPYSFIPEDAHLGKMKASPMMGVNFGVSYNPTNKLQFNAMISESRIWDVANYANAGEEADNYKYGVYGAVNCFYNINSYLQWGIEYLYGRHQTWNIGGANDNRIQTQLSFTF